MKPCDDCCFDWAKAIKECNEEKEKLRNKELEEKKERGASEMLGKSWFWDFYGDDACA